MKEFINKRFDLFAMLLIVIAVLIAYANTYYVPFHFDDHHAIEDNPRIKHISNIPSFFYRIEGPVAPRPFLLLTLAINYAVHGLNVVGYHIFNNLLHCLNGILVYIFVVMTLNLPLLRERYSSISKEVGLFSALLFVVHPIQTEAVTYIVSRSMPLATFFYLAGIILYFQAYKTRKVMYYIFLFLVSFAGMASREDYITFPVILFFYDALLMTSFKDALKRWWVYCILSLTVAYRLWLTYIYKGTEEAAGFGVRLLTPYEYLSTQVNVIWTYVKLLFLPINQNLDYDYPVSKSIFEFPSILSLTGHIIIISFGILMYKKNRLVTFLILWWYGTLSVSSSFIPIIDVIFEHRVYLPSIGFFVLFILFYYHTFDFLKERLRRTEAES